MKRKKSESRMDETLSLDVLKCFVCMDLVLEPTKTPCHCRTFSCAGCLAEWIKHAQAECLVCHQRFSARRLATDEGVKAYIVNRYPREYALRQAGESSTLFDQDDEVVHRVVSSGGELLRELEVMQEGERDKRRKADNDEESLRLAVQLAKEAEADQSFASALVVSDPAQEATDALIKILQAEDDSRIQEDLDFEMAKALQGELNAASPPQELASVTDRTGSKVWDVDSPARGSSGVNVVAHGDALGDSSLAEARGFVGGKDVATPVAHSGAHGTTARIAPTSAAHPPQWNRAQFDDDNFSKMAARGKIRAAFEAARAGRDLSAAPVAGNAARSGHASRAGEPRIATPAVSVAASVADSSSQVPRGPVARGPGTDGPLLDVHHGPWTYGPPTDATEVTLRQRAVMTATETNEPERPTTTGQGHDGQIFAITNIHRSRMPLLPGQVSQRQREEVSTSMDISPTTGNRDLHPSPEYILVDDE